MLPVTLAAIISVLTIWGSFAPVPFTEIRPQLNLKWRVVASTKTVLVVRGWYESVNLATYCIDRFVCHPRPCFRRVENTCLAELDSLANLSSHDAFELDLAAMQKASVPVPTRTLPVPSRVVTVESEPSAVRSRGDSDLKMGQAVCIVVALVSSLVSGLSFVLIKSGAMTKNPGNRFDDRPPPTESLVEDSSVESSTNAADNSYRGWELVPYTGNVSLVRGAVPTLTVPVSTPKQAKETPLVELWKNPVLSRELSFHPIVSQDFQNLILETPRPQQLLPPAQPQEPGVMDSTAELNVSTTPDSAPIPEEPVGPPTVVSSTESSPAVLPVEKEEQPEPTTSETPAEIPATTVEVPDTPPESAVAVTAVPESDNCNSNGTEPALPKEEQQEQQKQQQQQQQEQQQQQPEQRQPEQQLEQQPEQKPLQKQQQEEGPQAESDKEAGEADPAEKKKRRNRPSKKTRQRQGRARLLAAQDQAIRQAEEQVQAPASSSQS
ncbi:predicted protein [Uncinocarpus reesii 1704]|uniref:Uncharacterized protein n=1 Tax=Uncinocarpus reesii (strain UAMH 1704) TaxID=336963 RepID=C4JWF9_UNCRE|nr:uncharacterized protein UREG_06901 [Uncinocarpus reesii 1704]EEP82036.1 predicted protein [Uncinocarpus reesii 1704]